METRSSEFEVSALTLRLSSLVSAFVVVLFVFQDRVSLLLSLDPVLELALIDQAGLKLRDPPASAFRVLGLKVCATTAQCLFIF